MQKRRRVEDSKSNNDRIDRHDKYMSILGGLVFSVDPMINEYIQDKLSALGQCYLLQKLNPFLFHNHPIQEIGYLGLACEMYVSTYSGTLNTSTYTTSGTAASYGFVVLDMQYCLFNDTASVYGMSASSQARATSITTATTSLGLVSATMSSTLSTTDLGSLTRRYRIVSYAVRIKNVSGRDYMGGTAIGLRTPFNGSGLGLSFENLTDYTYTKIEDFDSDWLTVFWIPKEEADFQYYSTANAIASTAALQIHFKGPSTTVSSVAQVEVVAIGEVVGYNEKMVASYARNMTDFYEVMQLLQHSCHYKGSHTNYNYSLVL